MRIQDCQIDNFVRKASHPILLFPSDPTSTDVPFMQVKISFNEQNSIQSLIAEAKPTVLAIDSTTVLRLYRFRALVLLTSSLTSSNSAQTPSFERYIGDLVKCARRNDFEHRKIDPEEFSDLSKTSLSQHIFFEELIIYPQDFTFTFTADDSALSTLVDNTHSVESAAIHVRGFKSSNLFLPTSELRQMLLHHYKTEMRENIVFLIGSLAAIGAPTELIERVGDGMNKFFVSPFVGLKHGGGGFVSGVRESVKGLKNGVGGVAKSLGMVGEGILGKFAGLSGDIDYMYEREVQRRLSKGRATIDKIGASLSLGFGSGVKGITSVLGGEVAPEASEIGLALAGLVVKPIVGVGDGVAEALIDLGEDKGRRQIPQRRSRKVVMRAKDGKANFIILSHDRQTSMAEDVVQTVSTTGGTIQDRYCDRYVHHILCVNDLMIFSEQYLWLLNREDPENCIWCSSYRDISHYRGMRRKRLGIGEIHEEVHEVHVFAYSLQGLLPAIIEVEGASKRDEIFAQLINFADLMGNAGKFGYGERCQITGGNVFGSTNFCGYAHDSSQKSDYDDEGISLFQCAVPQMMGCEVTVDSAAVVVEDTRKILSVGEASEVRIDRQLWTLVEKFRGQDSYCFGLGIINVSDLQSIVLNSVTLCVGKRLIVIDGGKREERSEEDSWVIKPGGSILLVATGEDETGGGDRVVLDIVSSTFQVHFSDAKDGSFSKEGDCAVLEKAMGDRWWSKAWLAVGLAE